MSVQERGEARRRAIADAARARLVRLGFEGTTFGDLAADLDVSKAAIAYYFPAKDTFLDEFVTPFLDALEAAVSVSEDLRAVVAAYLDTVIAHHDIAIWVDTDPAVQHHDVFGTRLRTINDRLTAVVTGGSGDRRDTIRAFAVLGALWRPARQLDAFELRAHFDEIVDAALASS